MSIEERFWKWQDQQPEPEFVERWRTPGRTKALIVTYFSTMTLALLLEIAALFWLHLIWPAMILLLVSMVAWTLLRNTIGMRDAAPREELDSYEQDVLDLWRNRALRVLGALLFVGALATIFLGVTFRDVIATGVLAVVTGLFMIFCYLNCTTLPAVGYALTFNRDPED